MSGNKRDDVNMNVGAGEEIVLGCLGRKCSSRTACVK